MTTGLGVNNNAKVSSFLMQERNSIFVKLIMILYWKEHRTENIAVDVKNADEDS